jgi:uncharacterized protein (TIGR03435 family)
MVQWLGQRSRCGSGRYRSGAFAWPLLPVACSLYLFAGIATRANAQETAALPLGKPPVFEVVSIKPSQPDDRGRKLRTSSDRITIENFTLKELIVYAYNLKDNSQVLGGPNWLEKLHFDIVGVASEAEVAKLRPMTADDQRKEWSTIAQSVLAERFRLQVRLEMRAMPVYTLVVAKSGSKLKPAAAGDKVQNTLWDNGRMNWTNTSMESLAYYLTRTEGRVVLDRTGLTGRYDFTLGWTGGADVSAEAYAADLLAAMREQLGLNLKSAKVPLNVVIVDTASVPTAN